MNKLWLLALAGCAVSEETKLLQSWVGVYEVTSLRLDVETCTADGEEIEPYAPFLLLDAVSREEEPDSVALRLCDSEESCDSAPWFDLLVDELGEEELLASISDYLYLPALGGGECAYQWSTLALSRGDEDELHAEILSYDADLPSETEAGCPEALAESADEVLCAAYHVLDGSRVR